MAIEPGNYVATVEDYGIGQSKGKGTPFINIKFKLKDSGLTVYWNGWLTEKTMDRNIESLIIAKLLRTPKVMDLAQGVAGGGLSTTQECEISVINEEYTKDNGEVSTIAKVNFVNPLGGRKMSGVLDGAEAVTALQGLNLDAAVAAAKTKTGMDILPPDQVNPAQSAESFADDAPF